MSNFIYDFSKIFPISINNHGHNHRLCLFIILCHHPLRHLNLYFGLFDHMFPSHQVAKCQPFYRYSLDFPVSRLFMIPCFQKNIPLQTAICILPNVHLGDALHSHLVLPKSFHRYHSSIFLTDHTFECSIFKPETLVGLSPSESLTTT